MASGIVQYIYTKIKRNIKVISITFFLVNFVGIFNYIKSSKEYTSEITFMLDIEDDESGFNIGNSLGGFSDLLGSGFKSNQGGSISVYAFLNILNSYPYVKSVLETPVKKNEFEGTLNAYLLQSNNGVIGWILKSIFGSGVPGVIEIKDDVYILDRASRNQVKEFASRINLSINEQNGIIVLECTMPDPQLASDVVLYSFNYLQDYLNKYKQESKERQIEDLIIQKNEAQLNLNEAQDELTRFLTTNRNITSEFQKAQLSLLKDNYQLKFETFRKFSGKIDLLQLELFDKTNNLVVVNPAFLPVKKSSPSLLKHLVLSFAICLFIPLVIIFFKDFIEFIWKL